MHRIVVTCLSVHWMAVFALEAAAAVPAYGVRLVPSLAFVAAHLLVAAMFLWTALAAWGPARGGNEVARLGFSVGALVLAAGALLGGPTGEATSLTAVATQLLALGVTYLVIRAEESSVRNAAPEPDLSGLIAHRLALAAVHGSMLRSLSGRGTKEADG